MRLFGKEVKYRLRRKVKFGPFAANFTQRGFSSWSFKLGPFSWNSRTRKKKLDTPGPGGFEWR